jgi:putative transposase
MAQTFVSLMVHVIFSTKNREPLITPAVEPELFAYIGGILKNHESRLLDAGGTSNHVHLLVSQSKHLTLSSLMKDVKKDSSSWIKTKGREFRNFYLAGWLRRVFDWPVKPCQAEEIHCESERTSSEEIL